MRDQCCDHLVSDASAGRAERMVMNKNAEQDCHLTPHHRYRNSVTLKLPF